MAKKPLPTPEELRQLLTYDPETGKLFWKERTPEMFGAGNLTPEKNCAGWNRKYAGKEAFTATTRQGYKFGKLFNVPHMAHRIIWALHHGEVPRKHIDHINGDPADNRIANLRLANDAENGQNRAAASRSTSGHVGVHYDRRYGKWQAAITVNRKAIYLGRYENVDDAIGAYLAAKRRLHTFSPTPRR